VAYRTASACHPPILSAQTRQHIQLTKHAFLFLCLDSGRRYLGPVAEILAEDFSLDESMKKWPLPFEQ
jgi:hypothetical protein